MPGMGGIDAARHIRDKSPGTAVVILSAADDDQNLFEALRVGVCGYIVKDDTAETVLQAVANAVDGTAYLPPLIAKRVLSGIADPTARRESTSRGATPLTSRELMVLRLVAEGKRNREIAADLCISDRTVGNHISSIYGKLCIYDRAQAIVYAIKKGIVRV